MMRITSSGANQGYTVCNIKVNMLGISDNMLTMYLRFCL